MPFLKDLLIFALFATAWTAGGLIITIAGGAQ
jgi:hypothetical protein